MSLALFGSEGFLGLNILEGRVWVSDGRTEQQTAFAHDTLGYCAEVAHFVQCIEKGQKPLTNATDYLPTLACVQAIYQSAASGGHPVDPRGLLPQRDGHAAQGCG
jgi:predicted dehydrogenase